MNLLSATIRLYRRPLPSLRFGFPYFRFIRAIFLVRRIQQPLRARRRNIFKLQQFGQLRHRIIH